VLRDVLGNHLFVGGIGAVGSQGGSVERGHLERRRPAIASGACICEERLSSSFERKGKERNASNVKKIEEAEFL